MNLNGSLRQKSNVGKIMANMRQSATKAVSEWNKGRGSASHLASLGNRAVFERLSGAVVRAFLMVLLVATPAFVLPHISPDATQIVVLVALFVAMLTLFEYATDYPSLIEFRNAPPYNRIRYLGLLSTVYMIAVILRGPSDAATTGEFIQAVGMLMGKAMDFPYSPVRLVVLMLPETASLQTALTLRAAAGMAYMISLLTVVAFFIILRATNWPNSGKSFNVWINLPTFDPTVGGDVVARLERSATLNVALGFLLPFIIPAIAKAATGMFGDISFADTQTLVWTVAAWSCLPANLFMRGIAMQRVAGMIREKRERHAESRAGELQPV